MPDKLHAVRVELIPSGCGRAHEDCGQQCFNHGPALAYAHAVPRLPVHAGEVWCYLSGVESPLLAA